ncbi:MAG: glycosyltransferase family 2 protein [Acidobacteriia bacterium]|nr:glycosyltransferase family 2 protein [Terriglobia bacterium]
MEDIFYLLAALQIAAGLFMLYDGLRWLAYARGRSISHSGFYSPRVALICPCKGLEPGLEQNLHALCDFDYPNYEIFFVLASASDPAASIVHRVAASSRHKAQVLIAGPPKDCGEKVNNLRFAVEQLPKDFEAVVFADSDGRPGRAWLQHLLAPLSDPQVGAATTMRLLLPGDNSLPAALLSAWNASVITMLGDHSRNFCWGGGTAIRLDLFDKIGVDRYWHSAVSDDFSMTVALRQAGKRIQFVPECLVPSFPTVSFSGLLEFANRQMLLTRIYDFKLWLQAGLVNLLYCATLFTGADLFFTKLLGSFPALNVALLGSIPVLLAVIRGVLRVTAVGVILPAWKSKLLDQGWVWTLLAAFVPFLFLCNFLASAVTRKILWRGIRYELVSSTQTRILSH